MTLPEHPKCQNKIEGNIYNLFYLSQPKMLKDIFQK